MSAVDYFLKIDGIEGESQDSKHKNEIELQSFSWGEHQEGTGSYGGGSGAGKVQMKDFAFTMKVNKASPKLFVSCADGAHIKKALLTCRKAGKEQQEYLKVTFSDVIVSSYHTGGSAHSDIVPMDQVTLNFAKIELEYHEQKPDGTLSGAVKTGYDLKQQKSS
jgi:type VI secretion system secreted protein Hcp